MRKWLIILIVTSLGLTNIAIAQEDDPEDNACYTGGSMEGDCITDWHWICGWYLTRWEQAGGWFGNYHYPDWCNPVVQLPPRPDLDPVTGQPIAIVTICKIAAGTNYCVSSNQTATADNGNDGTIDVVYRFGIFPNNAACPPIPPGFTLGPFGPSDTATTFGGFGFSAAELAGIGPQACAYT